MTQTAFGVEDWVDLFEQIGLDRPTMHRWHALFERRSPDAHESFLRWLKLPDDEIDRVRQSSLGEWTAD